VGLREKGFINGEIWKVKPVKLTIEDGREIDNFKGEDVDNI
jgi:hypothetical protein